MLHSGGERRSVIGGDFGKKVRAERWNGGSRLKAGEREWAERCGASCCRGVMPKKSNRELSVETSESRGTGWIKWDCQQVEVCWVEVCGVELSWLSWVLQSWVDWAEVCGIEVCWVEICGIEVGMAGAEGREWRLVKLRRGIMSRETGTFFLSRRGAKEVQ